VSNASSVVEVTLDKETKSYQYGVKSPKKSKIPYGPRDLREEEKCLRKGGFTHHWGKRIEGQL